ncbi:MAG: hypothetical protein A2Y71_15860 [Bacteroidetes bacterium RBG_13_42_15]|nr:MAG: hypothetical protein A2Y71_15860 [Bacteroidetes bacterium RBG_13_42_15]
MFQFKKKDFDRIAAILGGTWKPSDRSHRLILSNDKDHRRLSLEIYPDIAIGKKTGNLISVYTQSAHLQLHFCTGYVVSEMLGEVTFVGECAGRLSGLIIEKGAACSLYSNVDASLLSGDFTKLGPEVMLSGIALSLVETILPQKLSK